jgi:hypothetical protein
VTSGWWHGLPGTDWAAPLPHGLRATADQVLAVTAVMTFWRPGLAAADSYGGLGRTGNKALALLADFLTPAEGEPTDDLDGFIRRRALIQALDARVPGTRPEDIIHDAAILYARFRDPSVLPPPRRRMERRLLRVPEPAG